MGYSFPYPARLCVALHLPFMLSKPHFSPCLPLERTLPRRKYRGQVYCVAPVGIPYPPYAEPIRRQPARLSPVGACILGTALGVGFMIAVCLWGS